MATSIVLAGFLFEVQKPHLYYMKITFILSKYKITTFQNYISVLAQILYCLLKQSYNLLFCRGMKSVQ